MEGCIVLTSFVRRSVHYDWLKYENTRYERNVYLTSTSKLTVKKQARPVRRTPTGREKPSPLQTHANAPPLGHHTHVVCSSSPSTSSNFIIQRSCETPFYTLYTAHWRLQDMMPHKIYFNSPSHGVHSNRTCRSPPEHPRSPLRNETSVLQSLGYNGLQRSMSACHYMQRCYVSKSLEEARRL